MATVIKTFADPELDGEKPGYYEMCLSRDERIRELARSRHLCVYRDEADDGLYHQDVYGAHDKMLRLLVDLLEEDSTNENLPALWIWVDYPDEAEPVERIIAQATDRGRWGLDGPLHESR